MFGWLTSRKLRSAWSQIESAPLQARGTLETIARSSEAAVDQSRKKGRSPKAVDVATAVQAWLGVELCHIRLGNWDDAAAAEKRWSKLGEPSPEDIVTLCDTWHQESPQPFPNAAVAAYGRYFGLPAKSQSPKLTDKLRRFLEEKMAFDENGSEARRDRSIRWAQLLFERAPGIDWIQFQQGRGRFAAGQWREAAQLLAQAVDSCPENGEWQIWLGRAEWRSGRRVIGRRALLKAHQLLATPATAAEAGRACTQTLHDPFTDRDGDACIGRSPAEVGVSLLTLATEEAPHEPSHWLALARGYSELKQYDRALETVDRLLVLTPDAAEAYCVRGEVFLAQGNRAEARKSLERAQEINENSAVVARLAGDFAYEDRDYAAARKQYLRCPIVDWSDTAYRERLAKCHLESGTPDDVLGVALAEDTGHVTLRLLRGRALARLGRWDEALQTLETPDWSNLSNEYQYFVAAALAANLRYEEAASVFHGLTEVREWRDRARRQLGHLALAQNDDAAAEAFYVGEKNRAVTHEDLGRLLLVRGQGGSASKHFAKAGGAAAGPMANPSQTVTAGTGSGPAGSGVLSPSAIRRLGYAYAEALRGNGAPAEALTGDAELSPWAHEVRGHVLWDKHQFVEALEAYELALHHREHVPTQLLARLAEGYLQLSRFREALPHLVELARRRPDNARVAINLAYCRYHLGRKLFRRGSWETARLEWQRVRRVLEAVNPDLADSVGRWEAEAAYRQVAEVLHRERWDELPRTLRMVATYRERDAQASRWDTAEGLAEAFHKRPQESAAAFERAAQALTDHPSIQLGRGLSLEAAGDSAAAQAAFGRVLELTTAPDQQLLHVASRFSAAMSHATARQWQQAATVLEPVLGHPLLKQSGRISDADVAQAVVAYYGLAGQTKKTEELAGKYLQGGDSLSDILIGIVQADAGDYEGAVKRLSRAYKQSEDDAVKTVLVACFVSLAAQNVLEGNLSEAKENCRRALNGDKTHAMAQRLMNAIEFADNLGNLSMSQLENAISLCEPLIKTSKSVQLVRTLAILYHRYAIAEESRGRAATKEWGRCVLFWTNEIIGSDRFWNEFCDDFNEGKKSREQINPGKLEKLRSGLRNKMAKLHVHYLLMAFDAGNRTARDLHQRLIWQWDPDFEANELVENLRQKANLAAGEVVKLASGGMTPAKLPTLQRYLREARDALELAHKLAPERKDIAEEYSQLKKACLTTGA